MKCEAYKFQTLAPIPNHCWLATYCGHSKFYIHRFRHKTSTCNFSWSSCIGSHIHPWATV